MYLNYFCIVQKKLQICNIIVNKDIAFSNGRRWLSEAKSDEVSLFTINSSSTAVAVPLLPQEKAFFIFAFSEPAYLVGFAEVVEDFVLSEYFDNALI